MKTSMLLIAMVVLCASPAFANDKMEKAASETVKPILSILTKYVFPVVAFATALYGIGRGVKKGEWDFAVMCIIASITLAVIPTVLTNLFGVK